MSSKASAAQVAPENKQDKPPMKTLANCTPVEFLRQTNKIRHAAAGLMADSGVVEIRKRMPALTGEETPEEKKRLLHEQAQKNMDAILDTLLETHAEETVRVLGMMCFLEPEEIENSTTTDFLAPAMELLTSKPVLDFLPLLAKLGATNTGG